MPDFGAVGGLMLLCTCCRWVCWPDLMGDGSVDGRRRQGGVVVGGAARWCACWIVLQMGGMERGRRVDGGSWSGHGRRWVDGRWLVVCCRRWAMEECRLDRVGQGQIYVGEDRSDSNGLSSSVPAAGLVRCRIEMVPDGNGVDGFWGGRGAGRKGRWRLGLAIGGMVLSA
ncbi:hypothetical protein ACLOJK_023229 [Asimina triloba]